MTNLEKHRRHLHLTQSDLARSLGVSRACVSRAERTGIRNSDAACRYAIALRCHPAELMEFDMAAAAAKALRRKATRNPREKKQ